MKKTLYILAIAATASLGACKGNKTDMDANKEMVLLTDSNYNSSYLTDTGAVANAEDFADDGVVSGKATVDARNNNTPRSSGNTGGGGSYGNTNTSGSSGSGTTASSGQGTQKKGISKAAKGAIIGGVGGAVAGAVISKKKGQGAVIGGVIGAAGGYIIGRSQDKKDGRVGGN